MSTRRHVGVGVGLVNPSAGGYHVRMVRARYLTGQMLLAMPGMADPRFARAAILMCAHDAEGALGIGLSQPVPDVGLHSLFEQLDIDPGATPDRPIHRGGPVEPGRGFVLHGLDWGGADTIDVAGRFALTGTIDVLRAIAEGRGPSRWVVALGYAGWSAGQLEGELAQTGWVSAPADPAMIFDTPADARWQAGYDAIGVDWRLLSPAVGQA